MGLWEKTQGRRIEKRKRRNPSGGLCLFWQKRNTDDTSFFERGSREIEKDTSRSAADLMRWASFLWIV